MEAEHNRRSDDAELAEIATLRLIEQANYDQQRKQAMAFAGAATLVSDQPTGEVLAVLNAFTAAPSDPVDLTDADIANMGREAGYTLQGWGERLEAYVKQARRHGVLK